MLEELMAGLLLSSVDLSIPIIVGSGMSIIAILLFGDGDGAPLE